MGLLVDFRCLCPAACDEVGVGLAPGEFSADFQHPDCHLGPPNFVAVQLIEKLCRAKPQEFFYFLRPFVFL
jgi:hypothetical protein